ncbi:MAG: DUF262 domain-containing protein [Tepidiformaceae bacterium]
MPEPRDEWMDDRDPDDYVVLQVPAEFRSVTFKAVDITIRGFFDAFRAGQIDLEPDFQREYVWDPGKASRFIESVMLGLPVPPVFLADEAGAAQVVIDGHQRLETLFRFLQPLLQGPLAAGGGAQHLQDLPLLTLTQLQVLTELNNRSIKDLSIEDRKRFWDRPLSAIILPAETHPDMKYVMFARLNLGSMSLNSQELRNCLYRGPYNRLILRLAESHDFLTLWGKRQPDKRMSHRELVLRAFALFHRLDRYRTPYRLFLNDEMEENRDINKAKSQQFTTEFTSAVRWIQSVFGNEALRLFVVGGSGGQGGDWQRQRHKLVYEASMVGFLEFHPKLDQISADVDAVDRWEVPQALRRQLVSLMADARFRATLTEGTSHASKLRERISLWRDAVKSFVESPESPIQEFKLVHTLLSNSNHCFTCSGTVHLDDAVIRPGGGGVAHRSCSRN